MFGKKILSIVGLLFLGSQISSVAAGCVITMSNTVANCAMKEGSDCVNGYYAVTAEDGDQTANTDVDNGKLVLLSGTSAGENCSVESTIGYFMSGEENKFISNNYEGKANMVTAASGCTAGQVDSNDSYKFCLDGTDRQKLTWNEGKNYIFKDVGQVFGNDANKKYIVTNENNKIIIKTGFDGKVSAAADDYCVTSSGEIVKRDEGFCDDTCDEYINCDGNGECRDITYETKRVSGETTCNPSTSDKTNCGKGYYLMVANTESTTFTDSAVAGVLWECKDSAGDCGPVDANEIPYGYLKNLGHSTYTYMSCNGNGTTGTCTAIDKSTITVEAAVFGNCSGKKPGDLMEYNGDYAICIGGNPVALGSGDSVVKYFVEYAADTDNIFGSKMVDGYQFMIDVQVGGNDVLLHDKVGNTGEKYKYTDADQKVYEKTDTTTSICSGADSIVEYTKDYKSDDTVDYFVKGNPANGPKYVAPSDD